MIEQEKNKQVNTKSLKSKFSDIENTVSDHQYSFTLNIEKLKNDTSKESHASIQTFLKAFNVYAVPLFQDIGSGSKIIFSKIKIFTLKSLNHFNQYKDKKIEEIKSDIKQKEKILKAKEVEERKYSIKKEIYKEEIHKKLTTIFPELKLKYHVDVDPFLFTEKNIQELYEYLNYLKVKMAKSMLLSCTESVVITSSKQDLNNKHKIKFEISSASHQYAHIYAQYILKDFNNTFSIDEVMIQTKFQSNMNLNKSFYEIDIVQIIQNPLNNSRKWRSQHEI